jgi:hypothetical protein
MSKIAVYFMPGLAASATIFERITLRGILKCISLEIPLKMNPWPVCKRIAKKDKQKAPVLIGVSLVSILDCRKWQSILMLGK